MTRMTLCVFEVLERAWASLDCSLIDMKIEFGINPQTGTLTECHIVAFAVDDLTSS